MIVLEVIALAALFYLIRKARNQMAFSQDMLAIATEQKTVLDSIKAAVDQLVLEERISPEAAAEIKAAFSGNKDEMQAIDTALHANTPPTP